MYVTCQTVRCKEKLLFHWTKENLIKTNPQNDKLTNINLFEGEKPRNVVSMRPSTQLRVWVWDVVWGHLVFSHSPSTLLTHTVSDIQYIQWMATHWDKLKMGDL